MKLVGFLIIGLAGAAGAATALPPPGQLADVVTARKAAFSLSAITVNSIKTGVDAGAPLASQGFAIGALSKWAHALPGMFPAGTSAVDLPGATAAKAEIWTDSAGFAAKAADYAAAVDRLGELAQANDTVGFASQFEVVRASCGSCHSVYRIERPRPPEGAAPQR